MSTYVPLGSRFAQGAPDTSGNNAGNWTVLFDETALAISTPYYEVYKIVVENGAQGSTFKVAINNRLWDIAVAGDLNSWDPNEPMPLMPGQTLFFYYSTLATDGHKPDITIWLRYDKDIPANQ